MKTNGGSLVKGREQLIKVINFIGLPLPDESSLDKLLSARRNSSKHSEFSVTDLNADETQFLTTMTADVSRSLHY